VRHLLGLASDFGGGSGGGGGGSGRAGPGGWQLLRDVADGLYALMPALATLWGAEVRSWVLGRFGGGEQGSCLDDSEALHD
jgi:hypothetical protein